MDYIFPGFLPPQFGQNGPWWFTFHQVPNLPEFLVEGKEREYISSFVKMLGYNPSAITKEDLDMYAEKYSAPGAMRDGFEYYRAFPLDAVQNKALVNQSKTSGSSSCIGSRLLSSIWRPCTWHSCS